MNLKDLTKKERIAYIQATAKEQEETRKKVQRVNKTQACALLDVSPNTLDKARQNYLGGKQSLSLADIETLLPLI